MTLFHLLLAICFFAPLEGAVVSATLARARFGGYTIAIVAGLVLGFGCAWAMFRVGMMVVAKLEFQPEQRKKWYAGAFLFSTLIWKVFSVFLGMWSSSTLLRLV